MLSSFVFPHRLVGDVMANKGKISKQFNSKDATIQRAIASAACAGRAKNRRMVLTISSRSAAPSTPTDASGSSAPSAARLRRAAQGYVDDKLREIFPPVGGKALRPADALFRERRDELSTRIVRWSGIEEEEAAALLTKLEGRCTELGLQYRLRDTTRRLMDATAMAVSLAMDFAYIGRFTD